MFRFFSQINRCDVFVILYCVYNLQDALYSAGRINQLIQLCVMLWAAIVAIGYILGQKKATPFIVASSMLVIMYTIYGLAYMLHSNVGFVDNITIPSYYYLQQSINSLLPIFVFYEYAKIGYLDEYRLRIYAILFLFVAIPNYYVNYQKQFIMNTWGQTEFTNNISYSFLSLFPFLVFFRNKPIIQYTIAGIILVFIISGMKRGAILLGAICFLYFILSNVKENKKVVIVILTIVLLTIGAKFVMNMLENSSYFISRINETLEMNSSGRDTLFSSLWRCFNNEYNGIDILIGRGANTTIRIAGNYAHQDWLETLINNGVVGVCILLMWFYRLAKMIMSCRYSQDTRLYQCGVMLFVICLGKSIFSMSIQSLGVPIAMILGYLTYYSTLPTLLNK